MCCSKWVVCNQLQEWNADSDYIDGKQFENNDIHASDSKQEKLDKQRRVAFTLDVKDHESEPRSPAWWKNFIERRSESRRLQRELAKKERNRKRSREMDDDIEFPGVRKRSSSASTSSSKRQHRPSGSNYLPTPVSSNKRTTSTKSSEELEVSDEDLFVRQSKSQSDPFELSQDEKREKNLSYVQEHPPTDDCCTIFVGPEQTPFQVPKDKVGECDFLSDRVFFSEELRAHIDLSEMQNISAKEFDQVWNYMDKGDFAPRLIQTKFGGHGLEGIVLQEEKDAAATKIAKVYVTAAKIQHGNLQQFCAGKLRALYSLSSHALLTVLMIFIKAEESLSAATMESEGREWLVDRVVENFWKLVKHENLSFTRLMNKESEIAYAVLARLGENPKLAIQAD